MSITETVETEPLDLLNEITYTEIPEMRDAFTKHFKRSDGKYVAIVYPEAVHTYENDSFVNLDNRLLQTANGRYQTANDAFQVSFAQNASDDELVSLSFEGYTLSWSVNIVREPSVGHAWRKVSTSVKDAINVSEITPEAARTGSIACAKSVAVVDANDRLTFTKAEIESTFMATSGITYQDAFAQNGKVDLVYTVTDNRLEEDIIVKEKGDIHSYIVTMNAPGLTVVLENDNSIVFYEHDGKDVFTIGAPWMCDAVYALSHDITVSLRQVGDTVTIVYTPDADWMNDSERVYPVLIDPSVRTRNYTANYQDTFVFEGDTANSSRANVNYMRIGKTKEGANEAYIKLLKYPMLTDAVTFHAATLTVYGGNVQNMKMKTVREAWDQTTITYATRPQDSLSTKSDTGTLHSGTTYRFCYDFTSEVIEYGNTHMNWMGYFTNYLKGFHLFCDPVGSSVYSLRSSEHTDTTLRPYVEIIYEYTHDIPNISQSFSSFYIAGYGLSMPIQYNINWIVFSGTNYSDGTVPTRSATLGIINTENVFYQKDVDHNDLLHSSATLELIDRIMNHNTTTGINGMEARPYENQES